MPMRGHFYEFFSGAGMARAGLGASWKCLFSNDFDHKKAATYRKNWGDKEFKCADVKTLNSADLQGFANLVWASFPCQDLSLAGGGAGLKGERSGTFWPFWKLIKGLISEKRAPQIIVLENVCGTLTSHDGKDFSAICKTFSDSGYNFGAVVVDASLFVPQSRPRLFIIGVHQDSLIPSSLIGEAPCGTFHTRALKNAHAKLTKKLQKSWVWWNIQKPQKRKQNFVDILEESPRSVSWHSKEETDKLLAMMSEVNLEKVKVAMKHGEKVVGTIYKRTRKDENGRKVQRAEVRFDNIAGCLRTPAGGSSRQLIMVVEGRKVKSRLISSRETARLMGLNDQYVLPESYNEAYHLTGDGVAVPVVAHLAKHVLEPVLKENIIRKRDAA